MIAFADAPCCTPAPDPQHARFLALLPRIERHARIYFRDIKCPDRKEDCVREAVALAWAWYRRLAARGRDPGQFASALAGFAARAARCGRRLAGQESANDVLSEHAQRRRGFTVSSLPCSVRNSHEQLYGGVTSQRQQDAFEERLQYNRASPVPDQIQFERGRSAEDSRQPRGVRRDAATSRPGASVQIRQIPASRVGFITIRSWPVAYGCHPCLHSGARHNCLHSWAPEWPPRPPNRRHPYSPVSAAASLARSQPPASAKSLRPLERDADQWKC
jgi:hypothetical protein